MMPSNICSARPNRYGLIISDGKQNEDFSGNGKILSREAMLAIFEDKNTWHNSLLDQAGRINPRRPEAVKSRADWLIRGIKQ